MPKKKATSLHWYGSSRSTWRVKAKNITEARKKIIKRDVGKIRKFDKE
jgi:hypothetical protein